MILFGSIKENHMKKAIFAVGVLAASCAYAHRNVIKALINGDPMPKAPSWHFWVSEEDRKSDEEGFISDEYEAI
jgi:hypothetical protein